jgi:YVTN family beta-propeller protein
MKTTKIITSLLLAALCTPIFTSCNSKDEVEKVSSPSSPRSLTAASGKVYIVQYDGHVTQLDTTNLSLGQTITVGANPDASVIVNNKLYVANTGGMASIMDSTISVIDLSTFKETKKIKVNLNPAGIKADIYGDVYVISNGDYTNIPGKFQRIEAGTDKVTDIDVKAKNFDIIGDNAYISNFEYDKNFAVSNKTIAIYDVKNEKLVNANIISTEIVKTPYCIDVNPVTKDIYLGVTDYTNNGKMYCFKEDGTYNFEFNTGVNPSKTVFSKDNKSLIVLNEGKYEANNAGLNFFDLTTKTSTDNYFLLKNNRGLGDTGQDMIRYGSKIYIAVYKSSIIEVIDAVTGISIKTIPMVTLTDKVAK